MRPIGPIVPIAPGRPCNPRGPIMLYDPNVVLLPLTKNKFPVVLLYTTLDIPSGPIVPIAPGAPAVPGVPGRPCNPRGPIILYEPNVVLLPLTKNKFPVVLLYTTSEIPSGPIVPVAPGAPAVPGVPGRPCNPRGPIMLYDPNVVLLPLTKNKLPVVLLYTTLDIPSAPIVPVRPIGPIVPIAPGVPGVPIGPIVPIAPGEPLTIKGPNSLLSVLINFKFPVISS